jgi:hypothetical protein
MIDDQGLYMLLTQGTSITDLTLGYTCFTTSMAGWPSSWRKLTLSGATLQEFAYLPLHSVQCLQGPLGKLCIPTDIPAAQLPGLLLQATSNLASSPAWVKAPPPQLELCGRSIQVLSSTQCQELLKGLAPVAGSHVHTLKLDLNMQLGGAAVEALADSLWPSVTSLHLGGAGGKLLGRAWEPLAQHFPNLRRLCLKDIKADVSDLELYLTMVLAKGWASGWKGLS